MTTKWLRDIDLQWLNDIDGLTVDSAILGTLQLDGVPVQVALVRDRSGKPVAATFIPDGVHPLDPTQRRPIWDRES